MISSKKIYSLLFLACCGTIVASEREKKDRQSVLETQSENPKSKWHAMMMLAGSFHALEEKRQQEELEKLTQRFRALAFQRQDRYTTSITWARFFLSAPAQTSGNVDWKQQKEDTNKELKKCLCGVCTRRTTERQGLNMNLKNTKAKL